jgi:LPXTG-motif cell wall-anchored protein
MPLCAKATVGAPDVVVHALPEVILKIRLVLVSLAMLVLLPGAAFAQNSPPQTIDEVLPTSIVQTTTTTEAVIGVTQPRPGVGGVSMPRTGSDMLILVLVGGALLLLGGVLVANSRRSNRSGSAA